jgi:hypothetical protein
MKPDVCIFRVVVKVGTVSAMLGLKNTPDNGGFIVSCGSLL